MGLDVLKQTDEAAAELSPGQSASAEDSLSGFPYYVRKRHRTSLIYPESDSKNHDRQRLYHVTMVPSGVYHAPAVQARSHFDKIRDIRFEHAI